MNTESITVISEIWDDILAIEKNASLYKETNFTGRADAMDFIDVHIIDRIETLLEKPGPKQEPDLLRQRAERVKSELEEINTSLFKRLREKLSRESYTKSFFPEMIRKYLGFSIRAVDRQDKIGYDNSDIFINGLLSDRVIPGATLEMKGGMVFYQKTPVRIVFEMVELAQLSSKDVFFDIGSGLGQVVILVNLISGTVARGIEYEPAYCEYAKIGASQLNLLNVEFINAEAHKGDYSQGTVFFLYTPFEGKMLEDMLEVLQEESRKRAIRVFTYGPCSSRIARQGWLNCVNGGADNPYKLYEFRSLAVS